MFSPRPRQHTAVNVRWMLNRSTINRPRPRLLRDHRLGRPELRANPEESLVARLGTIGCRADVRLTEESQMYFGLVSKSRPSI